MRKFYILIIAMLPIILLSCASLPKQGKVKEQKVLIVTSEGKIVVKLYNETPIHRDNFLSLVKQKVYDGVLFHRVIEDFMIQGGDPSTRTKILKDAVPVLDKEKTIPAEIKTPQLFHKYGALAAARMGDNINPEKRSSAYQFYIVKGKQFLAEELDRMELSKNRQLGLDVSNDSIYTFSSEARAIYQKEGGTPHLDGNYTVFGEVISGFEVIDKISVVETGVADKPIEDVRVIRMKKI